MTGSTVRTASIAAWIAARIDACVAAWIALFESVVAATLARARLGPDAPCQLHAPGQLIDVAGK
jgi:hypothetical protein